MLVVVRFSNSGQWAKKIENTLTELKGNACRAHCTAGSHVPPQPITNSHAPAGKDPPSACSE